MDNARITFVQTGGAPDKANCRVRWSVNGEKYKIKVQHDREDNTWDSIGNLRVDDIEYVSDGFNENGRWIILRYENDGDIYQLVAEGPEEVEQSFYYHAKIEKKLSTGEFKTVDDSLIKDMPEINKNRK